jgi:hypothetical protein
MMSFVFPLTFTSHFSPHNSLELIEFFFSHSHRFKREQFSIPKHGGGYDQVGGFDADYADGGGGGNGYDANVPGSPDSFEEIERPPLRRIDKYTRAECPCLSQRYTIAMMACLGFIISFGMRCNMGMAKLELENRVRINSINFRNSL